MSQLAAFGLTAPRFTFGPEREAAARDGVALTYYRSWNSTWFDPTPYFSKLTDFTVGVAPWHRCVRTRTRRVFSPF